MPGSEAEIDKCHTRSVSGCEHVFLLSQLTFTLLSNEVFKSGNVNMHLFCTSFYECLL